MIFDTHCHVQFPQYDQDRDEVIKRATGVGVKMICVGTDLETSREAVELAAAHERMWASVGFHPNDVSRLIWQEQKDEFEDLLKERKVVAVGEIGLDYYRTNDPEKQKVQQEIFQELAKLASKYRKPIIIHCRDAHKDMISILPTLKCGGVVHSFTGTLADAINYAKLGFYIGLNGIITFARDYDETVINAPLDRIVLETDSPYLAPEPYRGRRNEPSNVIKVAEQIARLRRISIEEVVSKTTANAGALFKL